MTLSRYLDITHIEIVCLVVHNSDLDRCYRIDSRVSCEMTCKMRALLLLLDQDRKMHNVHCDYGMCNVCVCVYVHNAYQYGNIFNMKAYADKETEWATYAEQSIDVKRKETLCEGYCFIEMVWNVTQSKQKWANWKENTFFFAVTITNDGDRSLFDEIKTESKWPNIWAHTLLNAFSP